MKNIKDKMTNIAKWMMTIGTFLLGIPIAIKTGVTGIKVPEAWLGICMLIGVILFGAGGAIVGHYGGKNDDGTTKMPGQITGNGI